mmetsp:Transcript_19069/g.51693  ORF Transcript_19069/g.51693 Transcript_19069/m.51693 type:complete len:204 (-) Transcript_19069:325-936(-)
MPCASTPESSAALAMPPSSAGPMRRLHTPTQTTTTLRSWALYRRASLSRARLTSRRLPWPQLRRPHHPHTPRRRPRPRSRAARWTASRGGTLRPAPCSPPPPSRSRSAATGRRIARAPPADPCAATGTPRPPAMPSRASPCARASRPPCPLPAAPHLPPTARAALRAFRAPRAWRPRPASLAGAAPSLAPPQDPRSAERAAGF